MSAVPGGGVGRGLVMKIAAIAAAQANAAAQTPEARPAWNHFESTPNR